MKDGSGRYRKQQGSMTFLYGFIVGDGVKRFGWLSRDALVASPDC